MMNERYKLNGKELEEIVDTEGYYADPSTYLSFKNDKVKIVDLLNKKDAELKEKDLMIDALRYALVHIRQIEVEIEIDEKNR